MINSRCMCERCGSRSTCLLPDLYIEKKVLLGIFMYIVCISLNAFFKKLW